MTSSHQNPTALPSPCQLLQMAKGDVEVKAAFEILRRAPSSMPFIQDAPLLARVFADVLHLSCWVTFTKPSQV